MVKVIELPDIDERRFGKCIDSTYSEAGKIGKELATFIEEPITEQELLDWLENQIKNTEWWREKVAVPFEMSVLKCLFDTVGFKGELSDEVKEWLETELYKVEEEIEVGLVNEVFRKGLLTEEV